MKNILIFFLTVFLPGISGQHINQKKYTNPVSNITGIGDPFVLTYDGEYTCTVNL